MSDEPTADDRPAEEHHHHDVTEVLLGTDEGTGAPGDATAEQLMANAIGGWRGLVDSSLPGAVFLIVYVVNGNKLSQAVWAAVAAGGVIAADTEPDSFGCALSGTDKGRSV